MRGDPACTRSARFMTDIRTVQGLRSPRAHAATAVGSCHIESELRSVARVTLPLRTRDSPTLGMRMLLDPHESILLMTLIGLVNIRIAQFATIRAGTTSTKSMADVCVGQHHWKQCRQPRTATSAAMVDEDAPCRARSAPIKIRNHPGDRKTTAISITCASVWSRACRLNQHRSPL